jgi:Mycothiol maleylpyruvate isomerase N-terminal domain/MDMPI C-terminal domain
VLDRAAPDIPVPACPEWNAMDLYWHLAEVQWFWGSVVAKGATTTAEASQIRAGRPATGAEVRAFYAAASSQLGKVLAAAEPGTPAWTWADDHTVGFVRRRQAHEALIHRIDAELTTASRTAMDPDLSADGVDEALRVMHGGDVPAWAALASDGARTLRIRATDTADSWFVTLGQLSGTDPADGKSYDQPGMLVAEADQGAEAAATIEGSAADLDCLLWHRPPIGVIGRSGTAGALGDFDALIAEGIS